MISDTYFPTSVHKHGMAFGTERDVYTLFTKVSSVRIRLGVHKFSPNGSLQVPHVIEDNFTHAAHSGVSGVHKQVTKHSKDTIAVAQRQERKALLSHHSKKLHHNSLGAG